MELIQLFGVNAEQEQMTLVSAIIGVIIFVLFSNRKTIASYAGNILKRKSSEETLRSKEIMSEIQKERVNVEAQAFLTEYAKEKIRDGVVSINYIKDLAEKTQKELYELRAKYESSYAELTELRAKITYREIEFVRIENELKVANDRISVLTTEVEKLEKQVALLRDKEAGLLRDLLSARADAEGLRTQMMDTKLELERKIAIIHDLEAERAILNEEIRKLKEHD